MENEINLPTTNWTEENKCCDNCKTTRYINCRDLNCPCHTSPKEEIVNDWESEFDLRFESYIKIISIGQYDENKVNIGFLPADEVIKSFIRSLLSFTEKRVAMDLLGAIETYVKGENYWDENSKYKFQKGALRARNKIMEYIKKIIKSKYE